ncbi:MAG TPA: ABC transporter permease, partial [Thermoanaerobaculia bacterium]|nr:ABC transporter permease [Thermoanaerobaculia bacterium]
MRDLWPDLRYSFRSLARRPGFTAVAVLTLALGIGANTAIFSAVHAFLIAPLPFDEPERLVLVHDVNRDGRMMPVAVPNYLDLEERASSFSGLAAYRSSSFNLAGGGERPERVDGVMATHDLFSLLGVELRFGSWLSAEQRLSATGDGGAPAIALLGEDLWRRRYGADPEVVGQTLDLDGRRFTIAGVVPGGFELPWSDEAGVWVPMGLWADSLLERGNHSNTLMIGRLAPGVTVAAANQEVEAVYADMAEEYPGTNRFLSGHAVGLADHLIEDLKPALLLLWGAVGFVLLIACANLANLMLVRGAGRHRELAVRRALGAGRGRLVRQLLTESLVLGVTGGGLGLLFGAWGIELLRSTADSPEQLTLSLPVFLFAGGLGVATGVAVGLLPALSATRSTAAALAEGGRSGGGDRSGALVRRALVGAEIALALVLLIGAGLMIESFRQLARLDLGFATDDRLIADVLLPDGSYGEEERRLEFYDRLLARLEARPEVATAAFASPLPLSFSTSGHSVD